MLTALIALTLSPAVQASGFYSADPGVRANGRSGAFTAGADDLSAQLYNPAALTRLRRPQAMISLSGVSQKVNFDRLDEGDLIFDPVENSSAPFLIPNFAVSHTFGLPDTTFALGLYTPYAPTFEYPEDGPQRFALTESSVLETSFGPSVAHRFGWLSVGAGFAWKVLGVTQDLTITTGGEDDPIHDVGVRLEVYDWSTYSWNAGVLAEPTDWLAIGVQFTPPVSYEARGSFQADMSNNFFYNSELITDETASDDDIALILKMPMIIRSGVAVKPMEELEIEVGYTYSGWSSVDELLVTDVELILHTNADNPLIPEGTPEELITDDDIVLPAGYQNTSTVRLGVEYDINEKVSARAGGMYETAAVPRKTLSVQLVDGVKYGYSAGVTVQPWERWAIDGVWSQTFLAALDIKNSEYAQVYVEIDLADLSAPPEITDGKIVSNGTYDSNIQIFGLAATHYFGKSTE